MYTHGFSINTWPENEDVSTLAAYSKGKTLQAVPSSSLRTAVLILEEHLFSVLGTPFTAAFCPLLLPANSST
jgi:hypothetical protein